MPLSFPFRLTPSGRAAVVEEDTDEENAERIAALVLTRRGERELAPQFGVEDPVFQFPDAADLAAGIALFGPDVEFTMETTYVSDRAARVEITFE